MLIKQENAYICLIDGAQPLSYILRRTQQHFFLQFSQALQYSSIIYIHPARAHSRGTYIQFECVRGSVSKRAAEEILGNQFGVDSFRINHA